MISLSSLNLLTIGLSIHPLNNLLVTHYGTIKAIQRMKSFFLVSNEDFIDINSQSNSYFFVTFLIFRHVRQDFSVVTMRAPEINNYNLSEQYTTIAKTIKASVNQRLLFITHYPFLFSFSKQSTITQIEKLLFTITQLEQEMLESLFIDLALDIKAESSATIH